MKKLVLAVILAMPIVTWAKTVAECEVEYERCCDKCRDIPSQEKARRSACWQGCMNTYAACLGCATK